MTESEWLACTDFRSMMGFLHDKASDRKLRLFLCACCRRIWNLLSDKRSRKAVGISEQYADGLVTEATLQRAAHAAWQAACKSSSGKAVRGKPELRRWVWEAVGSAVTDNRMLRCSIIMAANAVVEAANDHPHFDPCLVLRDIFGDVLYPVELSDSWRTWNDSIVINLAEAIYYDRDFARLPILADALEEAGCNNADILTHLRGPGPHVRGCWVVDLCLNKG
jgi:hypothetical protein